MGRDRGGHSITYCHVLMGGREKRNAMQCIVTAQPSSPPPPSSPSEPPRQIAKQETTVSHSRFIIFAPSRFHPASLAALAHATSRAGAAKQVLRMGRIRKASKPCQCHAGAATLAVSRGTLQD